MGRGLNKPVVKRSRSRVVYCVFIAIRTARESLREGRERKGTHEAEKISKVTCESRGLASLSRAELIRDGMMSRMSATGHGKEARRLTRERKNP